MNATLPPDDTHERLDERIVQLEIKLSYAEDLLEKFPDLARRMHVAIGILTVPAEDAQEVAEMMVASGIQAIWNFAPIVLDLPETVIVEDVALSSSLGVLSRKLSVRRKAASVRDSASAGP